MSTVQDHSLLYMSKQDIIDLGGLYSEPYVKAVTRALELHAKRDIVQPLKPYLRVNEACGHIADRIIAMPAYVGGDVAISGLKWIGSKHDNPAKRHKERASALIILNDPESNYPVAVMEGSVISGMRTAAVTAIGARYLARESFRTVSVIGCGVIARMQITSLLEQFDSIRTIHLYDLNDDTARQLADEIGSRFDQVEVLVEDSSEQAVRQAEVLVTATVASSPHIPYEWIAKGTFVSNISIMDLHKDVFTQADKVVVDDWDQSNREKKIINQLVLEGKFSREQLHAELGEILIGAKSGREHEDEIIVLNPMGMAIEDISSAAEMYARAVEQGKGTRLWL
ncbi:2,3-diaminopropionate biosynthesis protein SbnB [Paenibacillus taichungensis]|uniref:2,3-diaminopropionate biosynthesis protein SbnB n=1 Tax=Paenibacillus taichungensis TaxID=484184 RepID=UPI002DB7EEB1|nr:2,3-diaminopropionate biosynthesis protein SbnB [Paenibacillus taichungensis]MEC0108985.1 2,3-diaminopropionate biosynthesis protein SbnB [Paenibacillus taichungensis]MEC0197157.1 2,3-diaminopropionate biosynthesis protein SbnB [Paenibacillus taichungensis]